MPASDLNAANEPCHSWRLAHGKSISLDRPRIMAILNITPDSFADGGKHETVESALAAAARFVHEGTDIIDIGGESTRPGASRVAAAEQIRRVVPIISAIRAQPGLLGSIPISIDTTLSDVAQAAIDAGADAINDVSGGREDTRILRVAAETNAGMILMHRLRPPETDSFSDQYAAPPISGEMFPIVRDALADMTIAAASAGLARDSILIDPGLGFGKTVEQNLELIRRTPDLVRVLRLPLLSALSKKSFVGRVSLGRDSTPHERLSGTLALSALHCRFGATVFRVHDVQPHREALNAVFSLNNAAR